MTRRACLMSALGILVLACGITSAQSTPPGMAEEGNDDPVGNVHLGFPIAIPLNPTARAVHLGFGVNVGGGYNFSRKHAAVGEFMWNDLLPTNEALAKLRTTLQDPSLKAGVHVFALSGNYRYELRGQRLGAYFLGGAGLFYRHTSVTKEVISGNAIVCNPIVLWWGVQCSNGFVTENQTVGSWSATAPGFNGGIGFTARVNDPPYRFYVESRYHYAPNSRINTQLIDITFGIRY